MWMMIEGRIQKCRGSKRTWHRHRNNKMSEKLRRMKKKKKKGGGEGGEEEEEVEEEEVRQYTTALGICCRHMSTGFGNHPMSYHMTAERHFPRDTTAVM
jgi:hypothetical protein